MNLNDVHRGITKNKNRKRIGRGPGSGHGKTAGRGHKGQGARAGFSMSAVFEGGQMPLIRRVPKRGFNNRWALVVAAVNVGDLDAAFEDGAKVTPEALKAVGLTKGQYDVLKVLAGGELTKKLVVSAHRFSKSAMEKIQRAGGQVLALPGKKPVARKKMRAAR